MKFHPLYAGRFAMGLANLGRRRARHHRHPVDPQAARELLAGVADPHARTATSRARSAGVEHRRFNESFMQHASTSPFYPLFASLDVGAQMMKGRSGEVLWDDTIRLGIELRKKIRADPPRVRGEGDATRSGAGSSIRSCPSASRSPTPARRGRGARRRLGERVSTDQLATDPRYWQLAPGQRLARLRRHGAGLCHDRSEQADPADAGLRPRHRRLCRARHPRAGRRAISAREPHRAGEERPQLAALPADARRRGRARPARWSAALVAFKRLHDDNALLEDAMPEFYRRRPARYAGVRLRDLCGEMHASSARPMSARCRPGSSPPSTCRRSRMSPRDAARRLVRNNVDYLPIDAIAGRIATTPLVVYPPGHRHHRARRTADRAGQAR